MITGFVLEIWFPIVLSIITKLLIWLPMILHLHQWLPSITRDTVANANLVSLETLSDSALQDPLLTAVSMMPKLQQLIKSNAKNVLKILSCLLLTLWLIDIIVFQHFLKTMDALKTTTIMLMPIMLISTWNARNAIQSYTEFTLSMYLRYSHTSRKNNSEVFVWIEWESKTAKFTDLNLTLLLTIWINNIKNAKNAIMGFI